MLTWSVFLCVPFVRSLLRSPALTRVCFRPHCVRYFVDRVTLVPRFYTDPEVLYLHAKACFDCDHKDDLGGFNIQTYLEMLQVCTSK